MKTKNLIFFFICIFLGNQLFAREKSVEVFLTNYFETENYKIEKYINAKNTLFFAYYSHDNTDIFQKALLQFLVLKLVLFINIARSKKNFFLTVLANLLTLLKIIF